MLGLKLNHVSKRGHRHLQFSTNSTISDGDKATTEIRSTVVMLSVGSPTTYSDHYMAMNGFSKSYLSDFFQNNVLNNALQLSNHLRAIIQVYVVHMWIFIKIVLGQCTRARGWVNDKIRNSYCLISYSFIFTPGITGIIPPYISCTWNYSAVNFTPKPSQNSLHSPPVGARYGTSFRSLLYNLRSAIVFALLNIISWQIWQRYNGIRLYHLMFTVCTHRSPRYQIVFITQQIK